MNPQEQNQPYPPAGPVNGGSMTPAGLPRAAEDRFIPSIVNPTAPAAPIAPQPPQAYVPQPAPAPVTVMPTVAPVPPTMAPPAPIGGTMPTRPGAPTPPVAKPVPKAKNPNSTQNSLQIAEVRDGIVIMNDGSFRAVVMVKSINFDLMSAQEQEAVEYSYQGFLNSLYFPVQIFLRSQKVDLQPYIAKLDKIRTEHDNMLLALLMEDYIGYIDALSQQTNIMDKKFYVIIPFFPTIDGSKPAIAQSKNFITGISKLFSSQEDHIVINEPDLEKAKDELRNRVQAVLGGLQQAGIQGLPLDTQELIELYYDTYNPDTATRQQLKNFDNLTADIITKGTGSAPQEHLRRELQ